MRSFFCCFSADQPGHALPSFYWDLTIEAQEADEARAPAGAL